MDQGMVGAKEDSEEGNGGAEVSQRILSQSRELKAKREENSLIFEERAYFSAKTLR